MAYWTVKHAHTGHYWIISLPPSSGSAFVRPKVTHNLIVVEEDVYTTSYLYSELSNGVLVYRYCPKRTLNWLTQKVVAS